MSRCSECERCFDCFGLIQQLKCAGGGRPKERSEWLGKLPNKPVGWERIGPRRHRSSAVTRCTYLFHKQYLCLKNDKWILCSSVLLWLEKSTVITRQPLLWGRIHCWEPWVAWLYFKWLPKKQRLAARQRQPPVISVPSTIFFFFFLQWDAQAQTNCRLYATTDKQKWTGQSMDFPWHVLFGTRLFCPVACQNLENTLSQNHNRQQHSETKH